MSVFRETRVTFKLRQRQYGAVCVRKRRTAVRLVKLVAETITTETMIFLWNRVFTEILNYTIFKQKDLWIRNSPPGTKQTTDIYTKFSQTTGLTLKLEKNVNSTVPSWLMLELGTKQHNRELYNCFLLIVWASFNLLFVPFLNLTRGIPQFWFDDALRNGMNSSAHITAIF